MTGTAPHSLFMATITKQDETLDIDIVSPGDELILGGEVIIAAAVTRIIVSRLRFTGDARIFLHGFGLLIKSDIIQGRAAITWPGAGVPVQRRAQRATDGAHGDDGDPLGPTDWGVAGKPGEPGVVGDPGLPGQHGADAPCLRIAYNSKESYGTLWIDLRGQPGQPGQDGGNGGNGGDGSQGGPPQLDPWCTGCLVPQGRGGHAGQGGDGGDGGHGGNGGCGGYLKVLFGMDLPPPPPEDKFFVFQPINIIAKTTGAPAQAPGKAGAPGRAGSPGPGGAGLGPANSDESTLTGLPAHDGQPGRSGSFGRPGASPVPDIRRISMQEYHNIS